MSWKDDLNKSQKTGSDYPKLDVNFRINLKKKDDKPVFSFYDGTKSTETAASIEGILLGSVMKLTAFDNDFGSNGGSYNSSYFVAKSNRIALFTPSGKTIIGDFDSLKEHISSESNANSSVKRAIIIATKGGVLSVETNIILDIEQMKTFNKELFIEKMIKVSPGLYQKEDTNWSAFAHKKLQIAKQSLAYTKIEEGKEITDELAKEYDVSEKAKMYVAWKDYLMKGGDSQEAVIEHNEKKTAEVVNNFENPENSAPPHTENDFTGQPDDDLPF